MAKKRKQTADEPLTGRLVDFSGGQNDAIHPALLNDNESKKLQCADLDQKGTLKPGKGSANRYPSPFDATNPVNGLGVLYKSDGTTRLVASAGTKLFSDTPHLIKLFDTQDDFVSGLVKCNIDTGVVPGSVKLGAKPNHTFTRASVAYNDDGTQVAADTPRYKAGKFGNGVFVEEAATNLLTANQSSVENDLSGISLWSTNTQATLTRDTSDFYSGSASAKLVSNYAGTQQITIHTSTSKTIIAPNKDYTFSVYGKVQASGTRNASLTIYWYDSTDTQIQSIWSYNYPIDGNWKRFSVTGTSPSNAAKCHLAFRISDAQQNESLYWDDAQLEQKPYATSWVAGGTTRNADQLHYTIANALPAEFFACGWFKFDSTDMGSYRSVFYLGNYTSDCYVVLAKTSTEKKLYLAKKVNGVEINTASANPATNWQKDDLYFIAIAQLTKTHGDLSPGMYLFFAKQGDAQLQVCSMASTTVPANITKLTVGNDLTGSSPSNIVHDALQLIDIDALEAYGTTFDSSFVNNQYTAVSAPTPGPAHLLLANMNNSDGTAATGTLTINGNVSDGEQVTIGSRTYEFDTNNSITAGNVKVDVSGGASAAQAVTALVTAITNDTSAEVTAVDGAGDTVVVTAKVKGVTGNSIATTETCANASWGGATLSGGIEGIRAEELAGGVWISPWQDVSQAVAQDSGTMYWEDNLPVGTSLTMKTRSSADQVTASAWEAASNGGLIASAYNTYLQVAAILFRTDMSENPELQKITVAYDGSPAATELLTGLTPGGNMFMDTLMDTGIIVNGLDIPKKYDGVNTPGDLAGNPPRGEFIAVHKNRVFMLTKSRLQFSDLLDYDSWPVLNFIDITPNDGDRGTGLIRTSDYLCITKNRSVHLLLGDSNENFSVRRLQSSVGNVAPRSLCLVNELIAMAGTDGIYLTDFANTTLASERMKTTWNNLNLRRLDQIASVFFNHKLYIAAPSKNSTINDTVIIFDTIRRAWMTRKGWYVSCWLKFVEAGHEVLLYGDSRNGQIVEAERGYSDNGSGIEFDWESKHFDFGVPERLKRFRKVYMEVVPALTDVTIYVSFVVDNGLPSQAIPVTIPGSQVEKVYTVRLLPSQVGVVQGHSLGFKITQSTPDAVVSIHSISIEYFLKGARPTL